MMSKTYSRASIDKYKGGTIVFDANIWIFINGYCNPKKIKTDVYSDIYKRIIERDVSVVVTDQIVSEIVNRCIKFEFELSCQQNPELVGKFKSYRSSKEFAPAMEGAIDTCYHIINDSKFSCISHEKDHFLSIIDRSGNGLMDINDISLYDFCKKMDYGLVTDDGDFINCDIDIITENTYILNNRKI